MKNLRYLYLLSVGISFVFLALVIWESRGKVWIDLKVESGEIEKRNKIIWNSED